MVRDARLTLVVPIDRLSFDDCPESVPNERTYVFCYVLSDLGNLQIDTTVNIALNTGNIYVVRYDLIASYLADKKVKLL